MSLRNYNHIVSDINNIPDYVVNSFIVFIGIAIISLTIITIIYGSSFRSNILILFFINILVILCYQVILSDVNSLD